MGQKRKRSGEDEGAEETKEEMWDLKEVVFVEDVHLLPVGRVTKVGAVSLILCVKSGANTVSSAR